MLVLFIYSNRSTFMPPHYHHGVGHLSSFLKAAGHTTRLLVYESPVDRDRLVEDVRGVAPDVVAFSAATNQYKYARQYSTWLKTSITTPIVVGGVHATLDPDGVLKHEAWDYVVSGEGEEALAELVDALKKGSDPTAIANVSGRFGGKTFRNPLRPLVENLDILPFPDRTIFDAEHLLRGSRGAMSILAGRGCPYGCTYCCNPAFQRVYRQKGHWVRMRTPDNVIAEIDGISKAHPVKYLYFDDDVFTLDKEWMYEFLDKYKRSFSLPFRVNVRVETADEKSIRALRDAGCEMIQVGVEHGDEDFRRKILKRPMTDEMIINVFRWADAVDIKTWSFNIVGFPGETPELAEKTISLNRKLRPDHLQIAVFNPYPGTKLHEECIEKGYISEDADPTDGFFNPDSPLCMPEMPREKIKEYHGRLYALSQELEDRKRVERKYAGRKIHFDLVDMIGDAAVVEPAKGYVGVSYFSIDDDVRKTLQEHPPASVSFDLTLPPTALMDFAIAVHPSVWDKAEGEGVEFAVDIGRKKLLGGTDYKRIFIHHLDPRKNPSHRRWFEFSVDLSEYSGKRVELRLVTAMKNGSRSDFNTAGWGNPLIVGK